MPDGMNVPKQEVMPRFDAAWDSYDPNDLETLRTHAHRFTEDAVEFGGSSVFFARQLDYVRARVYNRIFPPMNADMMVPDNTDAPEWVETITVSSYDSVGMAKIIANYADDLPRADVRAMVQSVTVKTLGDSYGYNINEIRASRATGAGLDVRKAEAARRAIDLKIAKIKMVGDADYGLLGLFNQPNIPEVLLPHTGSWNALTGAQIYENLNALTFAYMNQTLGVHTANLMCLAPTAYHNAATKLFSDPAGPVLQPLTPLALWQTMNPGIRVANVIECQGAEPGPPISDVALMYELSPDNLAHEFIMPFTSLPVEVRNLEFVVNNLARSGGVHIWYPLAFVKAITS